MPPPTSKLKLSILENRVKMSRALPFLVLFVQTVALKFSQNSTCSWECSGKPQSLSSSDPSINTTDIVCNSSAYMETPTGVRFRQCTDCLQSSPAGNHEENDHEWFNWECLRKRWNSTLTHQKITYDLPLTHASLETQIWLVRYIDAPQNRSVDIFNEHWTIGWRILH